MKSSEFKKATMWRAHIAFDMVGQATDAQPTLSAFRSLWRRLVLMGSMSVPLRFGVG